MARESTSGRRGPTAARGVLRVTRPSWRDPRLLVGVVLLLAGVVLGARAVAAAERTTGVYAVAESTGAGSAVTSADLRVVQVRLEDTTPYVPADEALPDGSVLLRGLGAGELLPRTALGGGGDLDRRPVALPVDGEVPPGVEEGGLVDVWVTSGAREGAQDETSTRTQLVAEAAEVAAVTGRGTGLAARTSGQVQVLVDQERLPLLLQALARDARVDVVPVPGGVARGGASGGGGGRAE